MKWIYSGDTALIEPYPPLSQLVNSRIENHPDLQKALTEGRMVTIRVSNNQFTTTAQGRGQVGHAVAMKGVPDLEVQASWNEENEIEAVLTEDSRHRLTEIKEGRQTVEQNIGVTQPQARSHTLFDRHQVKPTQARSQRPLGW